MADWEIATRLAYNAKRRDSDLIGRLKLARFPDKTVEHMLRAFILYGEYVNPSFGADTALIKNAGKMAFKDLE